MKKYGVILFSIMFFSPFLWAKEPVSVSYFSHSAIGGHDTTAYHDLARGDKAQKGDKSFVVEWKGAKWRFVTEADSKRFAANPEKFAPAYNGHCANALSLGEGLIKTNGKHWAIFDDQLYLFYAARGAKRWIEGDYKVYRQEASAAWADILGQ